MSRSREMRPSETESGEGRPPRGVAGTAGAVRPACYCCGRPLLAGSRFCDGCGTARDGGRWSVAIDLDHDWFAVRGGAARGFALPREIPPTRSVRLVGARVRIGRCSVSRNIRPEIDLWGDSPQDPCVSREHAELRPHGDGSWTVMDVGSANGTFVNGRPDRLPTRQARPLSSGDRVHVGVWTRLTLRCD